MNFEQFISSLKDKEPPKNISNHLLALWFDANDNWKKSHEIVQNINDKNPLGFMHISTAKKVIFQIHLTGIQKLLKKCQI